MLTDLFKFFQLKKEGKIEGEVSFNRKEEGNTVYLGFCTDVQVLVPGIARFFFEDGLHHDEQTAQLKEVSVGQHVFSGETLHDATWVTPGNMFAL